MVQLYSPVLNVNYKYFVLVRSPSVKVIQTTTSCSKIILRGKDEFEKTKRHGGGNSEDKM